MATPPECGFQFGSYAPEKFFYSGQRYVITAVVTAQTCGGLPGLALRITPA